MKKYLWVLLVILLVSCSNDQSRIDDLENQVLSLSQVLKENAESTIENQEITTSIMLSLKEKNQSLEEEVTNLQEEIRILKEESIKNRNHLDLVDLTLHEQMILDQFKLEYDIEVLKGVEALSICKLYLYSMLIEDYETVYELYTKQESYVYISKEDYLKEWNNS